MSNFKQSENSHRARKLIGMLSVFLLPAVSFAQNYGFRMMDYGNRGLGCNGLESSYSMVGFMSALFLLPLIWILVVIALFVFWLLMLIDAIKHSPEKTKMIWVIVIIFTQIIGALVYYYVEKRHRHKTGHAEHKAE
jgi:RsiW-degrading membrane proteinase PrsW (M82 family)